MSQRSDVRSGADLRPLQECFLNALNPAPQGKFDASAPLELSISDVFSVPFVGCVVSGVLLSGTVKAGDPVLIGVRNLFRLYLCAMLTYGIHQPDSLGAFIPTSIRSIERKRVRVAGAEAGQSVALALKRIRRNQVRKGMVLLSHDATPKAVQRFTASVLILYHNSTIARGYQAMAHIGSIRQTVKIVDIDRPFVRTGDRCQGETKSDCMEDVADKLVRSGNGIYQIAGILPSWLADPVPRRQNKGLRRDYLDGCGTIQTCEWPTLCSVINRGRDQICSSELKETCSPSVFCTLVQRHGFVLVR